MRPCVREACKHTEDARPLVAETFTVAVEASIVVAAGASAVVAEAADGDPTSGSSTTSFGYLDNGLGYYRFSYNGSDKLYVGVMAQEVLRVIPQAVARGPDGYLIVHYERLGLKFKSYDQWIKSGAQLPIIALIQR
jgi:hypothetical protein